MLDCGKLAKLNDMSLEIERVLTGTSVVSAIIRIRAVMHHFEYVSLALWSPIDT